MLKKLRSKLVHAKVFASRVVTYLALVNAVMLLFLTVTDLKEYNIDINLKVWFIPMLFIMVGLMVFIGWLEDRMGFFKEESKVIMTRTPQIIETLEIVQRLEKKIEKMENDNKKDKV